MNRLSRWYVAAACAAALACGKGANSSLGPAFAAGLPACAGGTSFFTVVPIDPTRIMGWVPLGNLNPPAHTFPTDHQYIYLTAVGGDLPETPLLAPGEMYITLAKVGKDGTGVANDYAVSFSPCQQVQGEFGHVTTIAPAILQALGAFDQGCNTYSPAPGQSTTQCYTKPVAIKVHAGDVIGTAKGLDLSLFDSRVAPITFANAARWQANPNGIDRFHVAPFSDYYAEPARSAVRALLGQYDGKVHRTVEPLGGSIATDVAGTAQGTWFNPTQPTYPESPHFSIVPDNVDPTMVDLSFGTSHPGFGTSVYRMFPDGIGPANRAPSSITPGPTIHCYDVRYYFGFTPFARLLLQLTDATTLVAEVQTTPGTCSASQPWSFTPAKTFTFRR
jgi:hypothetical protein